MSANMMALETILEQFISFKKKYEKLLMEHLEKEGKGIEHGTQYPELLKILHAELQSFEKLFGLCDQAIARGELDLKLQPQIKEALIEIAIMDVSLDLSQHNETMIEEKARKLAELLYASLVTGVQSINADNSVTFLSKMRVFPRVTAISHLDPISAINQRKMIETTMKHLGDMYVATITKMRNEAAAVQDINTFRQQAIVVYKALIDFSVNSPSKALANHATDMVARLTAEMTQDPKPHATPRPTPPGSSPSKL